MEKKWIYFGVFLDSISKAKNLSALETNGVVIPNDWKRFNHHMTIAFNDGSKEVYDLVLQEIGDIWKYKSIEKTVDYFKQEFLIL